MTDRGFTLLELLVALVIFALIMLGITSGTQFGLLAWSRQSTTITTAADLDAADRALRRLLTRMDPGTQQAPPLALGTAARFAFTSDLPEAAALPTHHADMVLMLANGQLVLQWSPHFHAQRISPPPAPHTELLLPGIDHLAISYWPHAPGTGWRTIWASPGLPALIRIHLDLPGRHWPDIIAAPAAAPPATSGP